MKSFDIVDWGRPLQQVIRSKPTPVGGQVLMAVNACGVCHSDLHIRQGYLDLGDDRKVSFEQLGLKLPFTLGHEIVGTVVARGPHADIPIGAKRVIYPWIGCGECRHCRRDDELSCEANRALGTRTAGGFSNYVLVPHQRYLLEYGGTDPNVAATCACSGLTAYSALRKLPSLDDSDTLLLIGAGGLGLAALSLASAMTGAKVVVADIDAKKLAHAERTTGCRTLNMSDAGAHDRLLALAGEKVRGVIDFVGSPDTLEFALNVAGKGASIIVVGLFGGSLNLSLALLPSRNLTLRGSYVGTLQEMRELLELNDQKKLLQVPIREMPIESLNDALEALEQGRVQGRIVVKNA